MDIERKICNRCKVNLSIDKFKVKRDDTLQKRCIECNLKQNKKCPHNLQYHKCKDCNGSSICEHNRQRNQCKDCHGSSICEHNRRRSQCKDCNGSSICEHNRQRYQCKDCNGSSICEHNIIKYRCKDCNGSSICEHNRRRQHCKECDPGGHLAHTVRSHIHYCLGSDKELHSKEYLGANIDTIKEHLESQFKEGMSWKNHGKWHIDHIIPLKYDNPTLEEQIERLHYKNLQPLWAEENISKGNRYCG